MKKVFVDTSALLALMDASDKDHLRVRETLVSFANEKARLVTCSYVLVETGALVKRRLSPEAFRQIGAVVARSMDVLWVDESTHQQAWERAAEEGKRGASLVDWSAFLLMRANEIETAFTLDEHFSQQGFLVAP